MYKPRVKLGQFYQQPDGSINGKISCLGLGSIEVASMDVLGSDDKPYLKLIADPDGDAYEIGAAFPKVRADGQKYHSISLDSLMFVQPISAALFPDRDDPQTLNMIWSREVPGASANANAKAEQEQSKQAELPVQASQEQKRSASRKAPALNA